MEQLKKELERREYHLAEVIDEVVFAENAQVAAEEKLASETKKVAVLEALVQNLLGYTMSLEQGVLIPALSDLTIAIIEQRREQSGVQNGIKEAQKLALSDRTQQLLSVISCPSAAIQEKYAKRRDVILRTMSERVSVEDAFTACQLLKEMKDELSVLLHDGLQRVAKGEVPLRVGAGGGSSGDAKLLEELENTRRTLEQVKRERDMLVDKARQNSTYEELQAHYHSELDALQKKVRAAEEMLAQAAEERVAVAQRFETLQRALDQAYQEKALLSEEMVRQRNEAQPMQQSASNAYRETHELRMEMDKLIREHSSVVTALESQIATLRMELANSKSDADERSSKHSKEQIAQLEKINDGLRRDLTFLQQRMLSSSNAVGSSLDTKIEAFEMTISALNAELASVEGKIAAVESTYADEKRRLVQGFDEERRRYQEERDECDALVLKMTNELECLVRENATLKLKLRHQ